MNTLDVFADLSWGSLERYRSFHLRIVREERAAELDKRILDLIAKPQDVAWARMAVDFYARETGANGDVFDLSKEAHRLTVIRDAARAILDAEGVRLAGEKKEAAANADAAILTLSKASRNQYWCQEVQQLDREVQGMVRDARMLMKQLSLLQQLVKETGPLLQAAAIDDEIRTLNKDNRRDKNWLSAVESLKNKITPSLRPLLNEASTYEELQKKYFHVIRAPIFSEYSICLDQIESGKWEQKPIRDKFLALNENLSKHGFSMNEYIRDFQSRWARAKERVDSKNRSLAEAELARKNAARDEANREKASPYEKMLLQVESGADNLRTLSGEFDRLDLAIKKLDFDLSRYIDKFQNRWSAARKAIVADRGRAAEEARLARAASERLAREQEAREREARIALEKKQKRKSQILFFCLLLWIPFVLAAMYFGFRISSSINCQWYAPFISSVCILTVWFFAMEHSNSIPIFYGSLGLICVGALVMGVIHHFSGWTIVFSVVAAGATIFLCTNTVLYDFKHLFFHTLSPFISMVVLISLLEFILPHMLQQTFWHTAWITPGAIAIATALLVYTFKGVNDKESGAQFGLSFCFATALSLMALIRSIVLARAITDAGAGKIFVLIFISVAAWFGSLAYTSYVLEKRNS